MDLVSRYAKIDGSHPNWEKPAGTTFMRISRRKRRRDYPGISIHSVERVQEGIRILFQDLKILGETKSTGTISAGFREFLSKWNMPYLPASPDEPDKLGSSTRAETKFSSATQALSAIAWLPEEKPITGRESSYRFVSAIAEEPDEISSRMRMV